MESNNRSTTKLLVFTDIWLILRRYGATADNLEYLIQPTCKFQPPARSLSRSVEYDRWRAFKFTYLFAANRERTGLCSFRLRMSASGRPESVCFQRSGHDGGRIKGKNNEKINNIIDNFGGKRRCVGCL